MLANTETIENDDLYYKTLNKLYNKEHRKYTDTQLGTDDFIRLMHNQNDLIEIMHLDASQHYKLGYISTSKPSKIFKSSKIISIEDDLYFSVNSYNEPAPEEVKRYRNKFGLNHTGTRKKENLKSLDNLVVDIDCKNVDLSIEDCLEKLENEIFSKWILPYPSAYVISGGGIHLYWRLNSIDLDVVDKSREHIFQVFSERWDCSVQDAYKRYMCEVYTKLAKRFIGELAYLGADSKCSDPTRVLRLPDTFNTKANRKCYVHKWSRTTFSFWSLAYEYGCLKIINPKKQFSPSQNYRVIVAGKKVLRYCSTKANMCQDMIDDLFDLLEAREWDIYGLRGRTLYIYASLLYQIYVYNEGKKGVPRKEINKELARQELIEKMKTLRDRFKPAYSTDNKIMPVFDEEIEAIIKRVTSQDITFKAETIVKVLHITDTEQLDMDILHVQHPKYGYPEHLRLERLRYRANKKRRERRRNHNNLTDGQQKIVDIMLEIYKMNRVGEKTKLDEVSSILGEKYSEVKKKSAKLKKIQKGRGSIKELACEIDIQEETLKVLIEELVKQKWIEEDRYFLNV